MDRRLTPANGRVAATHLSGQVTAERFTDGTRAAIVLPVADLRAAPDGPRDRQLTLGACVTVYDRTAGWAFVQAQADGYVGYVVEAAIGPPSMPTHVVRSRATHAYTDPDIKSAESMGIPFGARLSVSDILDAFAKTPQGYVPTSHLRPVTDRETDLVAVAERLIGTPYLWGGNTGWGLDCSALVQAALLACGHHCPGDSDLQEAALGTTMPPGTAPARGDLLFWKGHVAWVADSQTLLHANAHHMAVAYEPISAAIARIEQAGDGPVTRHARLSLDS